MASSGIFAYDRDRFLPCKKRTNTFECDEQSLYVQALKKLCIEQDEGKGNKKILSNYNSGTEYAITTASISNNKTRINDFPSSLKQPTTWDAPDVGNDLYDNTIDCSIQNFVAVALSNDVHIKNIDSRISMNIYSSLSSNFRITSLKFDPDGRTLAMGNNSAEIRIWDSEKNQIIRYLDVDDDDEDDFEMGYRSINRVSCMDWHGTKNLAYATEKGILNICDTRSPSLSVFQKVYAGGICGIKWSPNGNYIAYGSDDGIVTVWDVRVNNSMLVRFRRGRLGATAKALDWSSYDSLLASGNNTKVTVNDIRYNAEDKKSMVYELDTGGAKVSSIHWMDGYNSENTSRGRQLVTTTCSDNLGEGTELETKGEVTVWDCETSSILSKGEGHTDSIISSTVCRRASNSQFSSGWDTLISISSDETIRSWDFSFALTPKRKGQNIHGNGKLWHKVIR
jgi:WD40 repeat protein